LLSGPRYIPDSLHTSLCHVATLFFTLLSFLTSSHLGRYRNGSQQRTIARTRPVILLDWSGVDLTPKSTPYAEEAVELQDSNKNPDQIYTINSKSWQKIRKKVKKEEYTKLTQNYKAFILEVL
jgi:hypothetical protein